MKQSIILVFFYCTSLLVSAQSKTSASEILKQAELKRMPWTQMSFFATLSDSGSSGAVNSSYHVFFDNNKALVDCMEPASQKGNLLLLENNEMWYYIKSTAQPMKITAIQRLSGSVSFVDIARLSWTSDYTIDSFSIVKIAANKKEAYLLHLRASSGTVSYRKINLWVDKISKRPMMADIYLTSEKLYKTINFIGYQNQGGKEINTDIEFTDYFNRGRKSVLHFSKAKQEKGLPESYFIKEKMPTVSKDLSASN